MDEEMDEEVEQELLELDVALNNVVCSFGLGRGLELELLVQKGVNIEMKVATPNRVTMKMRRPETTATVFRSGKVNMVGARSEAEARLVARRYARTIQKLSLAHPALLTKGRGRIGFHNFRIVNVFASCALAFDVRLREFAAAERAKDEKACSYEPELNTGVVYRVAEPKATVRVLATGRLTLQGARVSAVYSALKTIYPLLRQFGKAKEKAKPTKAKKGKPKKGADKMWRGSR